MASSLMGQKEPVVAEAQEFQQEEARAQVVKAAGAQAQLQVQDAQAFQPEWPVVQRAPVQKALML